MASRPDSIARNTAFALAVQVTGAVFTGVLTLYLVRKLGPSQYGNLALALGIGALVLLPTDFGISASTARFVAERRGDPEGVGGLLADALKLKLVAAVLAAAALFAAARPIAAAFGTSGLTWPLRGIALSLIGQSVVMLFLAAFIAQGLVSRNVIVAFGESAVEFGASVALVALGTGAAGAAFGRAAGFTAGALLGGALIVRLLGRRALRTHDEAGGARRIGRYAGALFVIDGAFTLFNQIDILLIGAILGAASAGLFQAPMRMLVVLLYPGMAVANGVAPRVLGGGAGEHPRVDAFAFALRSITIAQAALVAPILVWAGPISELLLGNGYGRSAAVLRALAPYVFLSAIAPLVSVTANYLGEARRRVPVAVAAVLVNLVVDLVLIPRIGIVGGAVGTDVAFLLFVGAQLELCRRLLTLPIRPYAATVGRALLGTAAMAIVLAAFGTGSLSLVRAALGALAGSAVFVATLAATGELSRADLRIARSLTRSLAPSSRSAALRER